MNVHDSERLAGLLEQAGYIPSSSDADADVVVVNTCSVREKAEDKLFSRLGELRVIAEARGTRPVVVVAGCVAQQEGDRLRARSRLVDIVLGTQSLKQLPSLLERLEAARRPLIDVDAHDDVSFPLGVARRFDPVKASVTIVEGCDDFCAFCVVPHTRGRERMRASAEILAEVREAAETGRTEIHLLGQIVNHYTAPDRDGCDFATLLGLVAAVPGVERVRFASPHPRHVTPRLIEVMATTPQVCRHLHLPVQSGSSRMLAAMRRRHDRDDYLALVEDVRTAMPDIAITTDVIVGFPGETEHDFQETLSIVEAVRYHAMFSFKYSSRPNTLARKRLPDSVPDVEKADRLQALQELQHGIQLELHRGVIGRTVAVLADGASKRRRGELTGRTSGNTPVNFPAPPALVGRLVAVSVRRAGPNSLWGEMPHGRADEGASHAD